VNELFAYRPGFIPETGIKRRLSTTGLRWIIMHVASNLLQYFNHVKSGLGKKLVNKTGNKQTYLHLALFSDSCAKVGISKGYFSNEAVELCTFGIGIIVTVHLLKKST